MSGVIDEDGTQWEHCSLCSKFVRIEELKYEEPSINHPYGLDLCNRCARIREHVLPDNIIRAGHATYIQLELPKE